MTKADLVAVIAGKLKIVGRHGRGGLAQTWVVATRGHRHAAAAAIAAGIVVARASHRDGSIDGGGIEKDRRNHAATRGWIHHRSADAHSVKEDAA